MSRPACEGERDVALGSLPAGRGVDAEEGTAFGRRVVELGESFASAQLTSRFLLHRKRFDEKSLIWRDGLWMRVAANRNINI